MTSVEDAVRETLQNYIDACNSGNIEAFKATLAENVEWRASAEPAIYGREAVAEWAQSNFFDVFDVKFEAEFGELVEADSKVFTPGTFSLHLTPKDGSEPSTAPGSNFNILSPDSDGTWKYQYTIFNYDHPQS